MDMTGERFIAAPPDRVWTGLNDPAVLQACIPGCTGVEKLSDTQLKAGVAVKIGPIAAKFTGSVTLGDLDPPNGYTISGEGQGGVAGFAKGGAKVSLVQSAGGTTLRYTVNAQVGGKLAQLGARLIDATAKSMADQFFAEFAAVLAPPESEPEPAEDHAMTDSQHSFGHAEDHDHDPSNPRILGLPAGVLIATVCALVSAALVIHRFLH